jgi:hypothetical protein
MLSGRSRLGKKVDEGGTLFLDHRPGIWYHNDFLQKSSVWFARMLLMVTGLILLLHCSYQSMPTSYLIDYYVFIFVKNSPLQPLDAGYNS